MVYFNIVQILVQRMSDGLENSARIIILNLYTQVGV